MNQREKTQQVQTAKLREILNLFHEIDDQDAQRHSIEVIDQAAGGGSIALLVGPPERPRAQLWLRADLDAERVIWTSDVPGQPKSAMEVIRLVDLSPATVKPPLDRFYSEALSWLESAEGEGN